MSREDEIRYLMNLKDDDIDTTDIPEITNFDDAEIGRFYRPKKESISLRVDADVLHWFRQHKGYQKQINIILRDFFNKNKDHKPRSV